jgi:hypothetical protein
MEIPIAWVLGTIISLGTVIASLAGIMWSFVKSRIEAQDKIIESQNSIITKLQDDVERMSKGCGAGGCVWKNR